MPGCVITLPKTVSKRLDLSFCIFARRGEKYSCYSLALHEKERKQYLELNNDDTKREAAYRQCLKNISGIIEKSYVSEEDNGSSYARRAPGCLAFSSSLPVEESRFDYFTKTLLNKKRFQQASAAKQN